MQVEKLATQVIHEAYQIHRTLGPGLLESVYEEILKQRLQALGLKVEAQVPMSFEFDGMHFDKGFRIDLLIEKTLIVELKSIERLSTAHTKQVLTYLRLARLPLGLLLNFGGFAFKDGCKRVVNGHLGLLQIKPRWGACGGDKY